MISIIMPCYNLGEYIQEAIGSIINQTHNDWELIIINDGSTDNSWGKTCDYISGLSDKRIIAINQNNTHLSEARNVGIKHSSGEYILPLDPDDMIHPTCLEKMSQILDNNNNIHVVGVWQQRFGEEHWMSPLDNDFNKIHSVCGINYCSMYRKSVWETIGGYDTSFIVAEDWDFWMCCKEQGFNLYCIPEPLFYYRIRANSKLHSDQASAEIMATKYQKLKQKHPLYSPS